MPLPFKTEKILPVEVDEARRAELAQEAAIHNDRLRKLEADEAGYKSLLKATREAIEEEVQAIAGKLDMVTAGVEQRKVPCEWREHPERPMKQLVRLDTGEVIEEKVLEPDEAQREIPGSEAPAPIGDPVSGEPVGEAAKPAVETVAKKGAVFCPNVIEAPVEDDPRQDQLCGGEGAARRKGFCADCYESTGGKNGGAQQIRSLARRTRRAHLVQEALEREAEEQERIGQPAAGSA